jgi:polyphosphate kinase
MLRKSVELPLLPDGKIYLAVKMAGVKASRYAILRMPVSDACPRFVVLPSAEGRTDVIFLDDIIRLFLDDVFFMFNYEAISAHTFKVVRDAEFALDDDMSKSLTDKTIQALSKREHGHPVRLIYDRMMPDDMLHTLATKLGLKADRLESGGRYHRMRDLMRFPRVKLELEETSPAPLSHPLIRPFESILKIIRRQDVLLCYPYHTFDHLIDLLREAAVDPRVQSICITLYRTASHSKVVNALLNASRNGKQVTALVELKARFDEEQNIDNSDLLQEEGVRVIYSVNDLKVHGKLLLIERQEGTKSTRGYVYVGTGNFNEDTTRIYSDFSVMTSDQAIVEDARRIFDFLQHTHKHPTCKKLVVSPYYMRGRIENLIQNEIKNARKGKKSYFYGKFNSLTDEKIISLLCDASRAGVEVKLLVRGTCCLQAGVRGVSENIEVRSIVDRYLEHARLLIVCNGGKPQSFIMSADMMTRNLDRRVEVALPIFDKKLHDTLADYFRIQWEDNVKARLITPPYDNGYVSDGGSPERHRCQYELYEYFKSLHR